jgi:hypothetical protein
MLLPNLGPLDAIDFACLLLDFGKCWGASPRILPRSVLILFLSPSLPSAFALVAASLSLRSSRFRYFFLATATLYAIVRSSWLSVFSPIANIAVAFGLQRGKLAFSARPCVFAASARPLCRGVLRDSYHANLVFDCLGAGKDWAVVIFCPNIHNTG